MAGAIGGGEGFEWTFDLPHYAIVAVGTNKASLKSRFGIEIFMKFDGFGKCKLMLNSICIENYFEIDPFSAILRPSLSSEADSGSASEKCLFYWGKVRTNHGAPNDGVNRRCRCGAVKRTVPQRCSVRLNDWLGVAELL